MDIAALSIGHQQSKVAIQSSLMVLKKVMDGGEDQMQKMVKMMENSVTPHLGGNVDIRI